MGLRISQTCILTTAIMASTCPAQERLPEYRPKAEVAKATRHSQGLHGYIGFEHVPLPSHRRLNAGMGFYVAVWSLADRPLADFQIGLLSAWIQPDNSDNKDKPLAPPGTLARNWNEEKKARLQAIVEKLYANWTIDRDYMVPPTMGKLVSLDPGLLLTPPMGLEVGYVPIVTRQVARQRTR